MSQKSFIKLYFEAAQKVFGNSYRAEEWVDENSSVLNTEITTIEEAEEEIRRFV